MPDKMFSMINVLHSFALKYQGDWDKIYKGLERKEAFLPKKVKADAIEIMNKMKKENVKVFAIIGNDYPKAFQEIYKPPFVLFEKNGKFTEHPSLKKFYSFKEFENIKQREMQGIEKASTRYEKDILEIMQKKVSKEVQEGKVVNIPSLFDQIEKIAETRYDKQNKVQVLIEDRISDEHKQYQVGFYEPYEVKKAIFNELAEYSGYSDEELTKEFGSSNFQNYKLDENFNLVSPNKTINLGFNNDKKIILRAPKNLIKEVEKIEDIKKPKLKMN